jgi:hypothetical protein
MREKYDVLRALGPGIRALKPGSPPPTDLQVLLLRLAMKEAERVHYGGTPSDMQHEADKGISA